MNNDWNYAIEIKPNSASLLELAGATRLPSVAHEFAIEQPARIVVRFTCEQDARNFYYSHSRYDARFCNANAADNSALPVRNLGR